MDQTNVDHEYPNQRYAWYVVAILMLANLSAQVDRQILALLLDPIKRDLGIGDAQMGLLVGLPFGLFYATLGLPIGRLADSMNRRNLMVIGIALWSLMTAVFGVMRTYGQLLLARIGVGIGEAALVPPALSLLADYFPPKRLATALSVFGTGVFLGAGFAYYVSGLAVQAVAESGWSVPLLGEIRPWQSVFILVGLPGLLIALLMLTIREPVRRSGSHGATFGETLAYLREGPGFLDLTIGYSLFVLVNYGTANWLPAYFGRVHGWQPAEIGLYMGGATMIFGTLGIVGGGWIADRMRQRGIFGSRLLVGTIGALGALLCGIALYTTRNATFAKVILIPFNVFHALPFGAAQAAVVEITPPRMRGQVSAIYLLAINVVGFTLGPFAVGLVSDVVFRDPLMIGYAILSVAAVFLPLAALLLYIGSRGYAATVRRVQGV
ncbi:MAG: MFS transporter [Gemmatimonadota bacterium]